MARTKWHILLGLTLMLIAVPPTLSRVDSHIRHQRGVTRGSATADRPEMAEPSLDDLEGIRNPHLRGDVADNPTWS